ncbi:MULTISPECIES: Uma2 family endonuclease [unclassified Anabaena]|uniref:Uma2 family endonuclease n=1 Tax=unclassified Anabaena TaxID=2619674 RepID=UPI00082FE4CF|nr:MULTISPECIES: Uma2 family endonuclease [unclassified Anabaena]
MAITQQRYYTPEEYLALEETAEYKSEYIEGKIIPIAGGTVNHNQIALNFSTELNYAFKKQNYRVYMGDVRLWIPQKRIYTYPDVMIVAGEPEFLNNRTDIILNPQVIVEVLSKSTQGYDREDKFQAYRTISSLQEYLLINQHQVYVEQVSKTGKKQWNLHEYNQEDEQISLVSLPFDISLQDLYNKVKFEVMEGEGEIDNLD